MSMNYGQYQPVPPQQQPSWIERAWALFVVWFRGQRAKDREYKAYRAQVRANEYQAAPAPRSARKPAPRRTKRRKSKRLSVGVTIPLPGPFSGRWRIR